VVDLREQGRERRAALKVDLPSWLTQAASIRLISPLLQGDSLRGLVMLYDPPPPFDLTYEDRDLLRTVGRHVATLIAQQEGDLKLAEVRQFEAYHRLTSFLMHDLKNAVAQLQLAVGNAARHKHNPDFVDDMIQTVGNAVDRMNRLIEQLRDSASAPEAQPVDLLAAARAVVERCANRAPVPALAAAMPGPVHVHADAARLASALEHVLRNAQDACSATDRIELAIGAVDGQVQVVVRDSGAGMSAAFIRERLFRPFDSTKGAKGMGIGAYQVREYVQGIGGTVDVRSRTGQGTEFEIRLPLVPRSAGDA
jgi:putative PEP-CTERM system histidine kinase